MTENKKIWDSQLLPQIEEAFNRIKDDIISDSISAANDEATQAMLAADKNYKKGHNEFTYALWWILTIVGCLLIIPAYWLIKKIKSLAKNKEDLLNDIKEKENAVLLEHRRIAKHIDVIKIQQPFKKIIDYHFVGPIPQELIEDIKSLSLIDLYGTENKNTYKTSWGYFEDKILIHAHEEELIKYEETYTGSTSVSYYRNDKDHGVDVVTATITKPAYKIQNDNQTFAFMMSCSNLEFHLEGAKRKLLDSKFNKKHDYSALENKIFEDKTKWIRNDGVQFRMIFTPFTQETFVYETDNCKNISLEWAWAKASSFLYNEFKTSAHVNGLESYIYASIDRFANESRYDKEHLIQDMYKGIVKYYNDIYKSINFMWATTIMSSENHNFLIKKALDKCSIGNNNISVVSHKILASFHNYAISGANMQTFPKYTNYKSRKIQGYNFYNTNFKTRSFNIVPRVQYVSVYAPRAGRYVSVPVEYKEFIPLSGHAEIEFAYIPSKLTHYTYNDQTINNVTDKRLLELFTKNNIQYANNFLSYDANSNIQDKDLGEMIKLIEAHNKA